MMVDAQDALPVVDRRESGALPGDRCDDSLGALHQGVNLLNEPSQVVVGIPYTSRSFYFHKN